MSVTIQGDYVLHTDKAVLLNIDGEEIWLPNSQIEECEPFDTLTEGESTTLEISDWIAEQKGLDSMFAPAGMGEAAQLVDFSEQPAPPPAPQPAPVGAAMFATLNISHPQKIVPPPKPAAPPVIAFHGQNGFERHGIAHLTPDSLNCYIATPDIWVLENLFHRTAAPAPHIARRNAVERALLQMLNGLDGNEATEQAEAQFDQDIAGNDDERGGLGEFIAQAYDAFKDWGPPEPAGESGHVIRSAAMMENGARIAFVDHVRFVYPQHKLIVLPAATRRLKRKMPWADKRRRAICWRATGGYTVKLCYCTQKTYDLMDTSDTQRSLEEIKFHASRLERLLRQDADAIRDTIPLNLEAAAWRGRLADATEIFGYCRR